MSSKAKRSRVGCMTCRKRKVKCDETYPSCRRCTETGRKCDGSSKNRFVFVGSNSRDTIREPSSSPPHLGSLHGTIDTLGLDTDESRALDYFLHKAGPQLAGAQDGPFWTYLVPQVCHSDIATRNAVMVISYMFENPPETSDLMRQSCPDVATHQVLQWHSKSISGYRARLKTLQGIEKTELALLSCVLLTSIEYQQNNVQNALNLLKSGYDIAGTISHERPGSMSSAITELLIPILARQTVLMTIFGCPPPGSWFERFQNIAPTPITAITNLDEARAGLYTCLWKSITCVYSVYQVYALGPDHAPLDPTSPLRETQVAVIRDLGLWHRYFVLFTSNEPKKANTKDELAVSTMLMYYNVAFIWVTTCIEASQLAYDKHMARFESIVSHAEKIIHRSRQLTKDEIQSSFSFEMGIVPPLHFTGYRCRHPLIRRKAVELMRKAPRQEALFAAEMNALAGEKVIELEESAELAESVLAGTWNGTLPAEEDRCQDAAIHYEKTGGEKVMPELCYIRGTWTDAEGKKQYARGRIPLFSG